jgi:hypothetical protein
MQARCPNHTRIKEVTGAVAVGGDGLYIRRLSIQLLDRIQNLHELFPKRGQTVLHTRGNLRIRRKVKKVSRNALRVIVGSGDHEPMGKPGDSKRRPTEFRILFQ